MQDIFLNSCRKEKKPITVYLVNGVKLQGVLTGFDNFSIILKRNQHSQLVYKHSIATVVPLGPVNLFPQDENGNDITEPTDTSSTDNNNGEFEIA